MASVEDKREGSGALSLEKIWSLVRDLMREERESFCVEREQADVALHAERS